ncbi:MAG: DUF4145 domain-containing protein [Acidobacteriota bacterium]|nr:DUF4145 domain-containing protein [Acidobacteriota bacterium]
MSAKEKRFSPALPCRHCNNKTAMEIVAVHSSVINLYEDDPQVLPLLEGDIFQLLVCPVCSGVSLGKYHYSDVLPDDLQENEVSTILYPPSSKFPTALPTKVMSSYQAAIKVRSIDPNAYAVLLGRVLEIICEDRQATGNTLFNKLEDLGNRGEIPRPLVEMAHSLRQLRNVGAHASLGELTTKEIPFLDDLCRAILEYVYSAPDLIEKAKKRLDEISK